MSERSSDVSARADFVGGLAWTAFGLAIVAGALAMDRLEQFGATVYTAPGLVPGVLGAAIMLLGTVLVIRSVLGGAIAGLAAPWRPTPEGRSTRARTAISLVLMLLYTLGMIGRIPFPIATALFVFVFIMIFDVSTAAPSPVKRRLVVAALTAIVTSAVVSLVFERVFLVRLP